MKVELVLILAAIAAASALNSIHPREMDERNRERSVLNFDKCHEEANFSSIVRDYDDHFSCIARMTYATVVDENKHLAPFLIDKYFDENMDGHVFPLLAILERQLLAEYNYLGTGPNVGILGHAVKFTRYFRQDLFAGFFKRPKIKAHFQVHIDLVPVTGIPDHENVTFIHDVVMTFDTNTGKVIRHEVEFANWLENRKFFTPIVASNATAQFECASAIPVCEAANITIYNNDVQECVDVRFTIGSNDPNNWIHANELSSFCQAAHRNSILGNQFFEGRPDPHCYHFGETGFKPGNPIGLFCSGEQFLPNSDVDL